MKTLDLESEQASERQQTNCNTQCLGLPSSLQPRDSRHTGPMLMALLTMEPPWLCNSVALASIQEPHDSTAITKSHSAALPRSLSVLTHTAMPCIPMTLVLCLLHHLLALAVPLTAHKVLQSRLQSTIDVIHWLYLHVIAEFP